jgi:HSP20 family protein
MIIRRMGGWPAVEWRSSFEEMERLRKQMDRITSAFYGGPESRAMPSGVYPAINLTEEKGNYFVRAELPGVKAQDIDIQATGRNLSISGERKIPSEGENARYHRREREAGRFARAITLPRDITAEKIEAKLLNGILTVTLPKSEAARPRQITIK